MAMPGCCGWARRPISRWSREQAALKPAISRIPKRVVVAVVLGNALEFYDFGAYAFFAVYIGQAFLPESTSPG